MTKQEFEEKYLKKFNEQQVAAVEAVYGPVLLLAVPGSGKTTVLINRLGYMTEVEGIKDENILCLTYTNAATDEMKERYNSLFIPNYEEKGFYLDSDKDITFSTINSIANQIIKRYVSTKSKSKGYTLADEKELSRIIAKAYSKYNDDYATEGVIKSIKRDIQYIKNMSLSEKEVETREYETQHVPDIYKSYCEELKKKELMDFDDQLIYALNILKNYPDILSFYQERYKFICVDESQDTSKIQHQIINKLASKSRNIFMVGDEDQSIYGFRAAYPQALYNFEKTYPDAKTLYIEKNYRSTRNIIDVANRFIEVNPNRHQKIIIATEPEGNEVQIRTVKSREDQNNAILELAKNTKQETAIIFRNNESAVPIIDLLDRNGIGYNSTGFDDSFFTNPVVNDIKNMIKLSNDNTDSESFLNVYYKIGAYIGKKEAVMAAQECKSQKKSVFDYIADAYNEKPLRSNTVLEQRDKINDIMLQSGGYIIDYICDIIDYGNYIKEKKLDKGKTETLKLIASKTETPIDFLKRLDYLQDLITKSRREKTKLTLATIHACKGREFNRVYIADVFDGCLPAVAKTDAETKQDKEQYYEDRRLFYVAITRAKKELAIYRCESKQSEFCDEINSYINIGKPIKEDQRSDYSSANTYKMHQNHDTPFEKGAQVVHNKFGEGMVMDVTDKMVEVRFYRNDETKKFVISSVIDNGYLRLKEE